MLENPRNRTLLASDAVLLVGAPFLGYVLRFEGMGWAAEDARALLLYSTIALPLKLGIFFVLGLYRHLWRGPTASGVVTIMQSGLASTAACSVLGAVVLPGLALTAVRVPLSVLFLDAFFTVTILVLPRLVVQVIGNWRERRLFGGQGKRVLIAGAGVAGELILKELFRNPQLGLVPAGFIDDDARKHHHRLGGLPVFGPLSDLKRVVRRQKIGEVIIAMPGATGKVVRTVVQAALEVGVATRTVPGLSEILAGRVDVSSLRNVEIQDLLRREPIQTDLEAVGSLVRGRTVLVTGAGGSVGSELCRQLSQLGPVALVLVGHGENSVFDVLQELRSRYPALEIVPVIADLRDAVRTQQVLNRYRPHAVFHAAAHKHVPLMEDNVGEAVMNNVLGTRNVVDATLAAGTAHFVLISTDKAVRPTSVMGSTKRLAEMLVLSRASSHECNFVAVRFGNVLGSRGSVVPTFLRQIRAGGPVTVTHPEMRRYFLTIPEAVQLVLQAAALGKGGELFVLDMGEPVRVVDLAKDLIRLSGLEVGRDIEIRFIGPRPGERIHEEVFFRGENVLLTEHPKVLRVRGAQPSADIDVRMEELIAAAQRCEPDAKLRTMLRTLLEDTHEGVPGMERFTPEPEVKFPVRPLRVPRAT